jgi:hypothetical protein
VRRLAAAANQDPDLTGTDRGNLSMYVSCRVQTLLNRKPRW